MDLNRMTDGELAGAFAEGGANQSFDELVRRHGAMVLRVCRRITGNSQDGEDAAQQVFAVLCASAANLSECRSVGGWLYNASWQISQRVRRAQRTRRRHEPRAVQTIAIGESGQPDEESLSELYRAIEMLPREYCEAIVLHHLQGLTVQQVSELMSCSHGTTAARLSRGRAMIRERMTLRGVVVSIGLLDALLTAEAQRDEALAKVVALVPPPPELVAAIVANQGPVAVGVVTRQAPIGFLAIATGLAIRRWAIAACMAVCLGAGMVQGSLMAYEAMFPSTTKLTRAKANGSAIAEIVSAGAVEHHYSSGGVAGVPEPGSVSVVAIAALGLMRRRTKTTRD